MARRSKKRYFGLVVLAAVVLIAVVLPAVAFAGIDQWTTNGPYGGSITATAISPSFSTDNTIFAAMGTSLSKSTDKGSSWVLLSRIPYGSDINSLAISPNFATDHTIFAGAEFGGVFKSINGGSTWSATGFTLNSLESIVISPNFASDSTLFAGIASVGIYKSTDGGSSWSAVNTGPTNSFSGSLAISPNFSSDNTIFAGVQNGGMFKSTNGGASWVAASGTGNTNNTSLVISPNFSTDNTMFAFYYGLFDGGIYKSTNRGASWSPVNGGLTSPDTSALAISPRFSTDQTVFAVTRGGIVKSTNGGSYWNTVSSALYFAYSLAISPDFSSDNTLFASTAYKGIFKSIDGGTSWNEANTGIMGLGVDSLAISPNFASDDTLFAGVYGRGVFKSSDGGASWLNVNVGLTNTYVYSLAISPNFSSDNTIFVGTAYNMAKSTNGGASWSVIFSSSSRVSSIGISPNFSTDNTIFAGVIGSGLYKSTNGGTDWIAASNGITDTNIESIAVSSGFSTDHTIFAGTTSGIFKSTNGGSSWNAANNGLSDLYVNVLGISPNFSTDNTILAGTYYGARLYKSTSGGNGWSASNGGSNGLSNSPVWSIAYSPNFSSDNTVFAGTSAGVFKSTNGGTTWRQVGSTANSGNASLVVAPNFVADHVIFTGGGAVFSYAFSDISPPITTLATNPISPDGLNGWFNTNATIALSADEPGTIYYQWDSSSGAWTTYSGSFSGLEGQHTLYYYSVDTAGNGEVIKSQAFKADTTVPALFDLSSPASGSTTNNGSPALSWAASSDSGSGISKYQLYVDGSLNRDNISPAANSTTPGSALSVGAHTWSLKALDVAGNVRNSTSTFTINIVAPDTTPPTTTLSSAPASPDGQFGYYDTTPTVTLTSNEPGTTYYQWDSTDTAGWTTYSGSFTALGGQHRLYYYSVDTAGNQETVNSQFIKVNPDSERVVFVSNRDTQSILGPNAREIYTMNPDGTGILRLTNNSVEDHHPSLSRDGAKIAFYSGEYTTSQQSDIYVMNVDGTALTRVTNSPSARNEDPYFFPDGSKLIFQTDDAFGVSQIHTINIDGSNDTALTAGPNASKDPNVSPDGLKIVYTYADPAEIPSTGDDVYIANSDGSGATRITSLPGTERWPRFSADGTRVAFASGTGSSFEIYTVGTNGAGLTQVTNNGAFNRTPAFSPNGDKIMFDNESTGDYELYSANADGSGLVRLTNSSAIDIRPYWWGPSSLLPVDTTAPSTTLVTGPSTPDGTNGWYKTNPTVTLTSNEPGTTYYQWDSSSGPWTTYSAAFSGIEGQHTLYYRSVDSANNTETVKSQAFKVDTQAPASFNQNEPAAGATVNRPYPYFSWNDSTDTNSGIAKYQLYVDGSLAKDNIVGWKAAIPSTALANGSHTWFVRAWDEAGNYKDLVTRNLTISSESGKIVFRSSRSVSPTTYVMNPDGTQQTLLSANAADEQFAFSPDGSKVTFDSSRDGNPEIYVMNVDGTGLTRLTNNAVADLNPAFSPDGKKVAFASQLDGNVEIYTMNLDGTNITQLTNTGYNNFPAFSPDEREITFESDRDGNREIYIMNRDGTNQRNVTNNFGFDFLPSFSPDGSKIIFVSRRDGDNGNYQNDETYVMNIDGNNQTRLTFNASSDQGMFSIDGNKIALSSTRDGYSQIYVMNADGSNPINISNNAATEILLDWGPALVSSPTDITPPTTSPNTSPSSPDGTNSWFKTTPSITLTSNEPGTTYYQWDSSSGPWTTYSAAFSGLEGQHTLYYRSVDSANNTETVKSQAFKVDTGAPTIPLLSGSPITGSRIDLSWGTAADTYSGVAGYRLYNADTGSQITQTTGTSYSATGLSPNTQYRYYVKSYDNAGNLSGQSNTLTITTPAAVPDTTAPSAPTLQGFAASDTQINLYWQAATDNVGVAGYRIYNAADNAQLATTTASGRSFNGLTPGGYYSYYVKAYDAAGNLSEASNTRGITMGQGGTTNTGSQGSVTPSSNVTLTFSDITSDGITSVTPQSTPVAGPPSGFRFRGNQLEIQTTASFTGPIQVAVQYDPADIPGNEANLKLFHYEGGAWQDVTLYVDTVNNIVVGQVNSLSPFILGDPGGEPSTGKNTATPFAVGLLAIGLGLTVLFRVRAVTV